MNNPNEFNIETLKEVLKKWEEENVPNEELNGVLESSRKIRKIFLKPIDHWAKKDKEIISVEYLKLEDVIERYKEYLTIQETKQLEDE